MESLRLSFRLGPSCPLGSGDPRAGLQGKLAFRGGRFEVTFCHLKFFKVGLGGCYFGVNGLGNMLPVQHGGGIVA